MLDIRQKLIQELEEDGFCFIDESYNENTILAKSFKYSRPIFSDNIGMFSTYIVRIHILKKRFIIYASNYVSSFSLDADSTNNVNKLVNCVENAFLFYSIYDQQKLSIQLKCSTPANDIIKHYVKVNNERIYFADEDFENKFFRSIYDQVKQINKQTKITKAVLEHIENKQMLS